VEAATPTLSREPKVYMETMDDLDRWMDDMILIYMDTDNV
jgi:hypothetical protein